MRALTFFTMFGLALASTARAQQTAHPYFPLVDARVLSYKVTTKIDQAAPTSTDRMVTAPSPAVVGQPIKDDDFAYQVKPDGVYAIGTIAADRKVAPFKEPRKLLPADPKPGDKWDYREDGGVTSATCLGPEKVKVPEGEHDAVKIYLVTIGGDDGTFRRDVHRWFAKDVGLVKETVTERAPQPDGKVRTVEKTTELTMMVTKTNDPVVTTTPPAIGARPPEELFTQAQALARKGDHPAALKAYDAALAADPKLAKARAYKTLSLIALKQFDAAETEIARAREADPKDYMFAEVAGQLKIAQGQIRPGKTLYDEAAKLSPAHAGAVYTDLAAALSLRNDNALAPDIDSALKQAAAATPPSLPALFALGQSYANAGRPEAKQYLQRYVDAATALPKDQRDEQKLRLAKQLIRAMDAIRGN